MDSTEILKPKSIEEIKRDLEKLNPVDRLVLLSKIEIEKFLKYEV